MVVDRHAIDDACTLALQTEALGGTVGVGVRGALILLLSRATYVWAGAVVGRNDSSNQITTPRLM